MRLPGYGGAATNTAAVIAYLNGRNAEVSSSTATADSTGFAGGGACTQPTFPYGWLGQDLRSAAERRLLGQSIADADGDRVTFRSDAQEPGAAGQAGIWWRHSRAVVFSPRQPFCMPRTM
jgi:hypothetical protein